MDLIHRVLVLMLILASICYHSNSYPNGPPETVCGNGLPVHSKNGTKVPPQKFPSPYVIEVNTSTFRPGESINVTIKSYVRQAFRGLFVQVVPIPNGLNDSIQYLAAGLYERNIKNIKLMTCRYMLDTLGHKDRFMKFETSFKWRSPLMIKHDVVVRATILKEFDIYWHNAESTVIKLENSGEFPVEKLKKPWLEEVIKNVQTSDDAEARRELTRARFNKGFKNAITPEGNIMIQYVTNMLPFKDSPVPGYKASNNKISLALEESSVDELSATVAESGAENETTNATEITNDLDNNTDYNNDNLPVDFSDFKAMREIIQNDMSSLRNDTITKYYEVLTEALLDDSKDAADTLKDLFKYWTP
ncbi:DOMON domain-containing protein frrs1L [Mactra antiquata]